MKMPLTILIAYENPTHPHTHTHARTRVWLVYRPVPRFPSVYVLVGALGINEERRTFGIPVLAQIGALLGRVEVVAVCLADGHTVLLFAVPVASLEGPKGWDEGWVLLRHPRVVALLRLVTETAPETLLVRFG